MLYQNKGDRQLYIVQKNVDNINVQIWKHFLNHILKIMVYMRLQCRQIYCKTLYMYLVDKIKIPGKYPSSYARDTWQVPIKLWLRYLSSYDRDTWQVPTRVQSWYKSATTEFTGRQLMAWMGLSDKVLLDKAMLSSSKASNVLFIVTGGTLHQYWLQISWQTLEIAIPCTGR